MTEARVHVGGRIEPLVFRINGDDPNFIVQTERIEAMALHPLAPEMLDLLEIAAVVFAADGSVTRGGTTRAHMGTGWRRQFRVEMPVRVPDLWSRPDIGEALSEAVGFLTEDDVTFQFLGAPPEPPSRQPYFDFGADGSAFPADEVILFSGGLDSFTGALECLSATASKVVLVTHRSAQKAITRQEELGRYLKQRFPGRVLHLQVRAHRTSQQSIDFDQRSRSFLFAALGQAAAQLFGADRVNFYENGIISHNLPVSRQIVGTMATRTTHPLALTRLDQLMRMIASEPAPVMNRFQWLTKTEVVRRIAENGAEDQIPRAVSCTSVREQDSLRTHCGACTQCLDRRFAMLAAGLADHDPPEIYHTDVLLGARTTNLSRTIASEWLRHSLRLASLDDKAFLEIFAQELTRILRGHADMPLDQAARKTLEMHHRFSRAVNAALKQAIQDHASELADGTLPTTSLLRLHLGADPTVPEDIGEDPRVERPHGVQTISDDEDPCDDLDLPPDPEAPLVVSFQLEDGRPVVAVAGIGRITGSPARVRHALKPILETDRAVGLPLEQCRFMLPGQVPDLKNINKPTVRSYVSRCRKSLADDFEAIYGFKPSSPLLIQNRPSKGYRLDPTIRIRRTDQSK